jgi:PAS domain S-box-containing protein
MAANTLTRQELPWQSEEGERPYQLIFETIGDGITIHDAETGLVVEANAAAAAMHGYGRDEFTGRLYTEFLHPDSHNLLYDYRQAIQAHGAFAATAVHLHRDGTPFPVDVRGKAITYQQRPCLLSVLRDADQEIRGEQLEQQIAARIDQAASQATLQERQRLAQTLHDAVNQSLFSASLIAEVLPRLWERDPVEGRRSLEELRQLTRGTAAEIRGLLAELRPLVLTDSPLGTLVRQLGDTLTGRTDIPVRVTVTGEATLPGDVQVLFYRVCQETLNNIAKHAGASRVAIDLQNEGGAVTLQIRDNGRGFDLTRTPSGHYGLSMMRERAHTIGAELSITSRPGQGTQVVMRWTERQEEASFMHGGAHDT